MSPHAARWRASDLIGAGRHVALLAFVAFSKPMFDAMAFAIASPDKDRQRVSATGLILESQS
jgi:hypothetical protein